MNLQLGKGPDGPGGMDFTEACFREFLYGDSIPRGRMEVILPNDPALLTTRTMHIFDEWLNTAEEIGNEDAIVDRECTMDTDQVMHWITGYVRLEESVILTTYPAMKWAIHKAYIRGYASGVSH